MTIVEFLLNVGRTVDQSTVKLSQLASIKHWGRHANGTRPEERTQREELSSACACAYNLKRILEHGCSGPVSCVCLGICLAVLLVHSSPFSVDVYLSRAEAKQDDEQACKRDSSHERTKPSTYQFEYR